MFEVQHRDAAARIALRTEGRIRLRTPAALFVETPRMPAPPEAPLVLSERPPVGGQPWVQDLGSAFLPRAPDPAADLRIEADVPFPARFDARLDAKAEELADSSQAATVLVRRAPAAVEAGRIVALPSASALFRDPRGFAQAVTTLREKAGPGALLYAPGLGLPREIALCAYAGIDLFDTLPILLAARAGEYVLPEGSLPATAADEPPCACDACRARDRSFAGLVAHGLAQQAQELARARGAVAQGRLRELAEMRARSTPEQAALLRFLDLDHFAHFEARAPILRRTPLWATGKESLQRPEIERFRRRLAERYRPPESARVLLLVPCSATKPYSDSRTHAILDRALARVPNLGAVHKVVVTSPLGVVPMELELSYPAARYDLPVTGHWDRDEAAMVADALRASLTHARYERVVAHLDDDQERLVAPALSSFESTGADDPLSAKSLESLVATLTDAVNGLPGVPRRRRELDDMASRARWQFGAGAEALVDGATIRGRYPHLKVLSPDGGQRAQLVPDRGTLSLTMEGARRLPSDAYRVEIDDFVPRGGVYGVGIVRASPDIRPEDEVLLWHGDELRGVGIAETSATEMNARLRGVAVRVRHHA
ncbi:MAG TPA: archaeosine synthase subunit alpha [Candidatus Thermoplasmatota archaeon]|nr:archaeosine synthase subunit alpha [Candidatus Thermoplasmatota archaeon]